MKAILVACTFFTAVYGQTASTLDNKPKGLICREEYSYSHHYLRFHPVSDIANLTSDGFRLDFKVRAKSNAHIMLSANPFPKRGEETYEIVIGANQNRNSDIRKTGNSKQRIASPSILSYHEARGFWIYFHKDGRVLMGRENDSMPIVMWKDTMPVRVRFISFTTWRDVIGQWYFDCKKYQEEEKDIVTNPRPLTWTDKIRQNFMDIDPYVAPQPSDSAESKRTVVYTHLATRHIELDEKRSVIDVHGILIMSWTDERLKWSPEEYGNVTSLVLQSWEAWIPDIMLYNAADINMDLYTLPEVGMIVTNEGSVFWAPPVHFTAFCENIDLRKWPKDTQTCELRLGFWSQQHLLQMKKENTSYVEDNLVETEWKVADVSAETVWIRTPWANAAIELGMDITLLEDGTDLVDPVATDDDGEKEIVVHTSMAVKLTLERRNSSYNTILVTPLAMILMFTLISFWALPLGPIKLALQCLSLLTETLFLLATWRALPAHADHVPSIVSAYQTAFIMTCTSIVAAVMIICLTRYPPVRKMPSVITLVLTSEWITTLFFLPTSGEQVNVQYNSLEETQQIDEGMNKNDDIDGQRSWVLLSTLIDRTMFFIYTILFFYIFSAF
ncbi:neuronal acetylcholine receptor subunit eat-2-like isoform X2 [Ischnura elegans]|uniref:neuronal acetylcholine receptor subunit eat-2-like isoform X2 n=1 Tax=Ischnura elegans TaxID=197161 RepID=UPI001ED89271|nr:neuronal acetylcholine receptor subunit eat-2-like isoform X2 [Ischnura elegans]